MKHTSAKAVMLPLLWYVILLTTAAPCRSQRVFVPISFTNPECGCSKSLYFDANETNTPFDLDSFEIVRQSGFDALNDPAFHSLIYVAAESDPHQLRYRFDIQHADEMRLLFTENGQQELPPDKYYLLSPVARAFVQTLRDSVGPLRVWPGPVNTNGPDDDPIFYVRFKFDSIVNFGTVRHHYNLAYHATMSSRFPIEYLRMPQCFCLATSLAEKSRSPRIGTSTVYHDGIRIPAEARDFWVVDVNGVCIASGVNIEGKIPDPIPVSPGVYFIITDKFRQKVLVLP